MGKVFVWDITDRCNLRCKHCYNAKMYFEKKVDSINTAQKIETIKKIAKNGFEYLSLLGGEPLICEELDLLLKTANDNKLKTVITSNGVALTEKNIDILIKNKIHGLVVSLDGSTADVNDDIRGKGSFEKATTNIRNFVSKMKKNKIKVRTSISTTLTKKNFNDLINMPKLANELGVDCLIFSTFITSGNGLNNAEEFECEYNEIQDLIEVIAKEEFVKYPNLEYQMDMRPYLTLYLKRKYRLKNMIFSNTYVDCLAGEDMFYMTAEGHMHPCNVMINQEIPDDFSKDLINVDKVTIDQLDKIENNQYFRQFIDIKNKHKTSDQIKTCIECEMRAYCTPCPIHYYNKNEMSECIHIMKKEEKHFLEIDNKIPKIKNEVTVKENGDFTIIWNPKEKVVEKVGGFKKKVIDLIKESKSIREIVESVKAEKGNNKVKNVYNFLLDLRLNNLIDF